MRSSSFAQRATQHLSWRARRTAAIALDALRHGERTIITTPPHGLRFGNWLYLWLDAHARSTVGLPTVVRHADGMDRWLDAFPRLQELTVSINEIRFRDRRKWDSSFGQRFGVDFTRSSLDAFALQVLAPELPLSDPDELVVNVRRGDYYSSPQREAHYGFDQVGYIGAALRSFDDVDRVRVVSDDPEWARTHLDGLLRTGDRSVRYDDQDPLLNFAAICGARRLIGSNSTFSYWGGYISGARIEAAQIVMPRFHARFGASSDAYQLDPSWTIIEGYS